MGPEATAELYLRIVRLFQKERGAVLDADFPEMVILNLPLLDVVADASGVERAAAQLASGARKLEEVGAEFIAVPCNTVESCLGELRAAVGIPVLSIREEVAVAVRGMRRVGLLATESTITSGIYGKAFGSGVEVLVPGAAGKKETTEVILRVLAGKSGGRDRAVLERLAQELRERGAETVVLGCTELPLVVSGNGFVDTLDVLARAAYREAVCSR